MDIVTQVKAHLLAFKIGNIEIQKNDPQFFS